MTHYTDPHSGLVPIPVNSSDTPAPTHRPEPPRPSLTSTLLDRLLNLTRPAPVETTPDASLAGTWELRYLVDPEGIPQMLPEEATAENPVTITGNGTLSFDFGTTYAEARLGRLTCGRLRSGPFKMMRNIEAKVAVAAAFRIERTVAAAFTRAADAAVVEGQMSLLAKDGEVLAILVKW